MKKILIFIVAFFLLLASCYAPPEDNRDDEDDLLGNFWAQNFVNGSFYRVDAELLVSGNYCNVWVEKNSGVSVSTARSIADEYDTNIYNKMMSAFGENNISFDVDTYSNTMMFADALGDEDGKLCILLLDIKDGYVKDVNDSYVAGYFWAGDFFNTSGSNQRDMIYLDTYPGMTKPENVEEAYATLAHEMQHLMNFVTTVEKRSKIVSGVVTELYPMDTWIDEGLASAAEWVYAGKQNQERIDWYNDNGMVYEGTRYMTGFIEKGNNFFVWGNRGHNDFCPNNCSNPEHNQYALLDDYATVYLFFQWLRLQGGNDIYKKIIISEHPDYEAVVENINDYSAWDSLLETWLAANLINNSSNQYGYINEIETKVTYAPTSPTTVGLYPGEGVYSLTDTSAPSPSPTPSTNIVYKYISGGTVSSDHSANSILLTYNKNTDIDGNVENGIVTGNAPVASVSTAPANGGRSVGTGNRPIRIDAGDLLRRNGGKKQNSASVGLSGFSKLIRTEEDE